MVEFCARFLVAGLVFLAFLAAISGQFFFSVLFFLSAAGMARMRWGK